MTIRAQIMGVSQVRKSMAKVAPTARDKLTNTIKREALNLVAYVKQQKLSDQVLHVRTGRLRRSITAQFEESGSRVAAYVGTNVVYARPHEEGFNGEVNVPAHTVKEFQRMQTMAFGRPMKDPRIVTVSAHTVSAHSMKMNIPAKPFLKPSLEENRDRITTNIRYALASALIEAGR